MSAAVSPVRADLAARWSRANRAEREHARMCSRWGTWRQHDCRRCNDLEAASNQAAAAVSASRQKDSPAPF